MIKNSLTDLPFQSTDENTIYQVKSADQLSGDEIVSILSTWDVAGFNHFTEDGFRNFFRYSTFHLLKSLHHELLCVARINFDFAIRVGQQYLPVAELVGLAAVPKGKGHGRCLLKQLVQYLNSRQIETLGFCRKELRPFYEKCDVVILHDRVKFLRERNDGEWVIPTDDDDLLQLTLTDATVVQLLSLNADKPGYMFFGGMDSDTQ